jgi:hypothetical protein
MLYLKKISYIENTFIFFYLMDILVSRNPDSGNMETGIPDRKPPLIGLINTHKESKNVKPRAALRGISRLYICEISCILYNCQSISLSPDCMDTETGIFNLIQIKYLKAIKILN